MKEEGRRAAEKHFGEQRGVVMLFRIKAVRDYVHIQHLKIIRVHMGAKLLAT